MKTAKTARLASGLLAAKGTAAPSSANRENLGPSRVGQAIADAMIRSSRNRSNAAASSGRATGSRPHARVNLSVRLDRDRHRRLKLASVHLGIPAQSIMVLALDAYLDRIADDLLAASRGGLRQENGGETAPGADAAAVRRGDRELGS